MEAFVFVYKLMLLGLKLALNLFALQRIQLYKNNVKLLVKMQVLYNDEHS